MNTSEVKFEKGVIPLWDGLPVIDLYMDQVIILLNRYLGVIKNNDSGEDTITKNMINNYVKMKAVPAPVRKKYSREHIACLLIVCIMKQVFNISMIKDIMPDFDDEQQIKDTYNDFVLRLKTAEDENSARLEKYKDSFIKLSAEAVILKIMAENSVSGIKKHTESIPA